MSVNNAAPRRGRPPRIDESAIAAAVLEIGTENATMRRVAEHLGVSLPGLYHHVKNKNEILDGMVDLVFAEIAVPEADWKEAMRRRAYSARAALLRWR